MNTLGLHWTDNCGTWDTDHFTIKPLLDGKLTVVRCYLNEMTGASRYYRLTVEVSRYEDNANVCAHKQWALTAHSDSNHTKIRADVSAFVCWMQDENVLKFCPEVVAYFFGLLIKSNPGLLMEVA